MPAPHQLPPRRARRGALALVAAGALAAPLLVPVAASADVTGLVLHYEFETDEIAGGTVTDLSPSGLDGRIVNPAGLEARDGREAGTQALGLTGGGPSSSAPYVDIPHGLFEGRSAMTISTWVEWDGGQDYQWVYNLGRDASTATFLTPSFADDARVRSSIKPVNGGAEVGVPGSAKLPTNEWVHAVTVIDGTTLTFYLNGVEVGRQQADIDLAAAMHAPGGATSGFLGKPFWGGHPFYDGAIDDFRVYDSALTPDQVIEVFGQDLPEIEGVAQSTFAVRTTSGTAPDLPETASARYSDGVSRPVPVTWDEVDPSSYAAPGQFSVSGAIEGLAARVTAVVTVTEPGVLAIDLAQSTGDFHGGASGTLYGLYDEGLPSNNLIDAINLRTVATKAQDGPQHPGADALEIVRGLADSSDGDVYIYMTDIHRGFPYQWPGETPEEKLDIYMDKLALQVDQVLTLPEEYQDNVVLMPWNEPEGNMFGTGEWSYDGTSWLDDPTDFFAAWDASYRMIKEKMPEARIGGPNTSILYNQVYGFFEHAVEADTVPDVTAWHELSDPATIRSSVDRYRGWEVEIFEGTEYEGTQLPINITEYAFNYHTSVPGQMVQWIAALEDSKVFGDIAYWNIDGNLSDSAVEANRGNGQWWLLNAYAQMSGETVSVVPPEPDVSYTLQGVATRDDSVSQVRTLFGGAGGGAELVFDNVPTEIFGERVHAVVQEIGWSGQLGDQANPPVIAELDLPVTDGTTTLTFGAGEVPAIDEESAYLVILTPGKASTPTAVTPTVWEESYEAEDAGFTGEPRFRNGPEGSPQNQGRFYTSGGYNVGGLRTGSSLKLDFEVTVPQDGTYDLSVFASSLNTFDALQEQGPTNVFLTVDGAAEQEIFLPLGYKWVVWDQARTAVDLTAGTHTISLAAQSLDGTRGTQGDALIDKIDLSLANPEYSASSYEAEYAVLDGAGTTYGTDGLSGSGGAVLAEGDSATFWVYSADDAAATLELERTGDPVEVSVNGRAVGANDETVAFLLGGINKVVVTGTGGESVVDRLLVSSDADLLGSTTYEAEDAARSGTAEVTELSLATGGQAVTGIGGEPGNENTLTFEEVEVAEAGTYAVTVRYSNEEQSPATHYNPDPLARYAYVTVNGGDEQRVLFPHSFHENNFWELTFLVELEDGVNEIEFASREKTNFDGVTYASETWPGILLRSQWAPNMDSIRVTPFTAAAEEPQEPISFVDVPEGTQFFDEITWLAERGISTGWERPDGQREYRPVTPIARDAMAAFLYRMAGSPDVELPARSPFTDVAPSNQFYREIAWLASEGISTGWDNGDGTASYRPLEPIARDAMAAFLHRAAGSPEFTGPATSPFVDVAPGDQFYAEITWLFDVGVTTGWDGNDGTRLYQPLNPVNRDAMAAFLHRFHHNLG